MNNFKETCLEVIASLLITIVAGTVITLLVIHILYMYGVLK